MSFYFAHKVDNRSQKVSQVVRDKGLSLLRAKPCDVSVSVLPMFAQPGYSCYLKNLPAFMEATLQNKRVFISNRGYPIRTVPHAFAWSLPPLIFDLTSPVPESRIEQLRTHTDQVGDRKELTFVMREPTLSHIQALVNQFPEINAKTNHIYGSVNLDAMKSVFVVNKILSAFLLTHAYPALRHSTDLLPTDKVDTELVTKKRKTSSTSYVACMQNPVENTDDKPAAAAPKDDKADDADMQSTDTTTDIQLMTARPTPIKNDKWGSIDKFPNSGGLYIPFVRELSVADHHTVPTLIGTYFIRCLADTDQGMFSQLEKLRSGWGIVSQTDLGAEIAHICKCIDIALQAQAVVYPAYTNGVYEGSVICGVGFSVSLYGEVYEPLEYDALAQLVQDNSSHKKALYEIFTLLGNPSNFNTNCSTMRLIANLARAATLDDINRQAVIKAAYNLSFPNKYWSTSAKNVDKMMRLLADPELPIDDDVPMHPKSMFSSDRTELVMSAFGHQAPSFLIPNCTKISLASKTPPDQFCYSTIATEMAVADMKFCLEGGSITNNPKGMSNVHKYQPLKGKDKIDIWNMLSGMYKSGTEGTTTKSNIKGGPSVGKDIASDLW